MKKVLSLTLVLLLAFSMVGCGKKGIEFTDTNLQSAILTQAGKTEEDAKLLQEDLDAITSLTLSNKELTDLSGLEQIKNVETLDISNNSITDISMLANMKNLKTVNLQGNSISNFDALKDLENLTTIKVTFEDVKDVSKLANIKNATDISIKIEPKEEEVTDNVEQKEEANE